MTNILPFPGRSGSGTMPVEPPAGPPHDGGMSDLPARVAVLEQIAKSVDATLKEIKDDLRGMRDKQERDFRLSVIWTGLVGLTILGVMAKGFRWF
jgi:hypothetical protein